jgi:hypothetical protein
MDSDTSSSKLVDLYKSLGFVFDEADLEMVREPRTANVNYSIPTESTIERESKSFRQIASFPFVRNKEEALDIHLVSYSSKYKGSDFTFKNGEPMMMFQNSDGTFTSSYKTALKSGVKSIKVGFVFNNKMQTTMEIPNNQDEDTALGLVNAGIVNNFISESKVKVGKEYKFEGGGKRSAYKSQNVLNLRENLLRNPETYNIKTNSDEGTFSFDYIGKNELSVDGEVVTKEEFDKLLKKKDFDPINKAMLIKQRLRMDGKLPIFKPTTDTSVEGFKDSDQEILEAITGFLQSLGVSVTSIEQYSENYKVKNGVNPDANALADIANKVIALKEGTVSKEVFLEEVSHFLVESFQDQKGIDAILEDVKYTDEYLESRDTYMEAYANQGYEGAELERMVAREVLGKILAKQLAGEYKDTKLTTEKSNVLTKLKDLVRSFLNSVGLLPSHKGDLQTILNRIEASLLQKNFSDFSQESMESSKYVMYNVGNEASAYSKTISSIMAIRDSLNNVVGGKSMYSSLQDLSDSSSNLQVWQAIANTAHIASVNTKLLNDSLDELRGSDDQLSVEQAMTYGTLSEVIIPALRVMREQMIDLDPNNILLPDNLSDTQRNTIERQISQLAKGKSKTMTDIDSTLSKFSNVQGVYSSVESSQDYGKRIIAPLIKDNTLRKGDDEIFAKEIKREWTDIAGIITWIGSLANRAHPALNMLAVQISKIYDNATASATPAIQKAAAKLADYGFSNLKQFQLKDEEGVQTTELLNPVKLREFYQAKGDFSNYTKAKLNGSLLNGKTIGEFEALTNEDLLTLRNMEKSKKLKLEAGQDFLYKDSMRQWSLTNEEQRFTEDYYKLQDEIYKDISGDTKNYLMNNAAQMSEIRRRHIREEDGLIDLAQLPAAEKDTLKELQGDYVLTKSPFDMDGNLSVGFVMGAEGKPVIDPNLNKENLTPQELLKVELNEVQNRRNSNREALGGDSKARQEYINEIKRFEATGDYDGAFQFARANGGLTFTDEYWEKLSGFDKFTEVANALDSVDSEKAEYVREQNKIYKGLVNKRKVLLSASRVPNNPAEIEASQTIKEQLLEVEQSIYELSKEIETGIDFTIETEGDFTELESNVNLDYLEELDLQNIMEGSEEELKFLRSNMILARQEAMVTFKNKMLRVQSDPTRELSDRDEQMLEGLDRGSADFILQAQIRFARQNVSSYYKRTTSAGYTQLLEDLDSGKVLTSDLVDNPMGDLVIKPNYNWTEFENNEDYSNKNYESDTVNVQPKRSKWMREDFFSKMNIPEQDKQSFLNSDTVFNFDDFSATDNKDLEALKTLVTMRQGAIENIGNTAQTSKFILPSKSRDDIEQKQSLALREKGSTKAFIRDLVQIRPDELELGAVDSDGNPLSSYSDISRVPKFYTKTLEDNRDLSQEVFSMIANDYYQSIVYRERKQGQSAILSTLNQLKNSNIKGKAAANSNSMKMAKDYVDANLYGVSYNYDYKTNIMGMQVNVSKLLNTVSSMFSRVNLKWNPLVDVTGATTMYVTRKILEATEEYYSKSSSKFAKKKYAALMKDYLPEAGQISKKSELSNILYLMGLDEISENVENANRSRGTRIAFRSGYGLSKLSNLTGTPIIAMSVLSDHRWYNGSFVNSEQYSKIQDEGKPSWDSLLNKSLYHAFDFKTLDTNPKDWFVKEMGAETLLEGDELIEEINSVKKGLLTTAARTSKRVSSIADGVLPQDSRVMAQRNPFTAFLTTHRMWMSIIIDRKFKSRYHSFSSGREESGHYSEGFKLYSDIINNYRKGQYNSLSEAYKDFRKTAKESTSISNASRNIKMDVLSVAVTTMLAGFLLSMDDDDDNLSTLLALRTANEVASSTLFGIGQGVTDVFKDPIVMRKYIENAFSSVTTNPFEVEDRGDYKGYTMGQKALLKLTLAKRYHQLSDMQAQVKNYRYYNKETLFGLGAKEWADLSPE